MPLNKGISAVFSFRTKISFRKRGCTYPVPSRNKWRDKTLITRCFQAKKKNNLSISSKKSAIKSEGTEKFPTLLLRGNKRKTIFFFGYLPRTPPATPWGALLNFDNWMTGWMRYVFRRSTATIWAYQEKQNVAVRLRNRNDIQADRQRSRYKTASPYTELFT